MPSRNPRLLVVARKYWPVVEDSCHRLMHWLAALRSIQIESTVLTARWHASWPDTFLFRNTSIHRLLPSPHSNWNETHFQKNVVSWIQSHLDEFDAIYVDRADTLLQVLLSKSSRWEKPILARFAPEESLYGLASNVRMSLPAIVDTVRRCDYVLTSNPGHHRTLLAHGVREQTIFRMQELAWIRVQRRVDGRQHALKALAQASGDFFLPERSMLMVHIGIASWMELRQVLLAVCDLLDSGAHLRMWLINPGISYQAIYDLLKDRGWHREILIFDGFDDLEDLIQVADLAWVTHPAESIQFTLPLLLSAGVPILARESLELQSLAPVDVSEFIYCSPTDLALKLHRWYANPRAFEKQALTLRGEYLQNHASLDAIRNWRNLLERVAEASRS
ncbi:MAG: hypothetical protein KGQ60_08160 [Planctomycetes bacterium]|nr:hypothetical protein [Planctomycetota bacterium]